MSNQDEGLPLADAVRTYCDPELWAAYERARAKLRSIPPQPRWLNSSRREREAWSDRYEGAAPGARATSNAAWQAVEGDFTRRLEVGELLATGLKTPINDESQRVIIPAHLWSVLKLEGSSAKGDGLQYRDVRIRRGPLGSSSDGVVSNPAKQAREELQEAVPLQATANHHSPRANAHRRKRGQPSLMGYIGAELERLAAEDELCDCQAEQFRLLEAWARKEQDQGRLPKHRVPKARSIERSLKDQYQELREKKRVR